MNNVDWNDQIEKVRGDWLDKCHVTPEQKNLVADLLIIYRELSGLSEDADSDLYEDLTDWLRWICRERAGSEDCEEDLQALSRWFRDALGQVSSSRSPRITISNIANSGAAHVQGVRTRPGANRGHRLRLRAGQRPRLHNWTPLTNLCGRIYPDRS